MGWARLETDFPMNPKAVALEATRSGRDALWLYIKSLCHARCALSNGLVDHAVARKLVLGLPHGASLVDLLVKHRLWDETDGGYRIHDYLDYNDSAAQIRAELAAGRRRAAESKARRASGEASAKLQHDVRRSFASPVQSSPNQESESTALSGKPDVLALDSGEAITGQHTPSQDGLQSQAREVLQHLNARTGKSFEPGAANLRLIGGRLKDGASVEKCRAVIDLQVAEWGRPPKPGEKDMRKYLRPKTLFNATNFAQYLGALGAAHTNGTAAGQAEITGYEGRSYYHVR